MQLTLGQAAKQVGVSKPTLSKAMSTGKLSATRREDGSFAIDPSELCRYVEANGQRFHPAIGNGSRLETPATDAAAVQLAGMTVQTAMLREQLADARRDRDDARQERDHWRDQAQRLALPKPIEPKQTWWQRLRSTV